MNGRERVHILRDGHQHVVEQDQFRASSLMALTCSPERRSIAAMLGFDGACPVAQLYGVKADQFSRKYQY